MQCFTNKVKQGVPCVHAVPRWLRFTGRLSGRQTVPRCHPRLHGRGGGRGRRHREGGVLLRHAAEAGAAPLRAAGGHQEGPVLSPPRPPPPLPSLPVPPGTSGGLRLSRRPESPPSRTVQPAVAVSVCYGPAVPSALWGRSLLTTIPTCGRSHPFPLSIPGIVVWLSSLRPPRPPVSHTSTGLRSPVCTAILFITH